MPLSANSVQFNVIRWRLAIVFLFLLSVVVLPLPVSSADIRLQSDTEIATAGFFRLSWSMDDSLAKGNIQYRLQSSRDAQLSQPRTLYRGPDLARVISGQADGEYYYQVRAYYDDRPLSGWSEPLKVTVAHHSLTRALAFFIAGAVVFFSLLVFIVNKHTSH